MSPLHNRVDLIRPDAPSLAARGPYAVGVQTHRLDIAADRTLMTEIWYPAAAGTPPGTTYDTILRDGITPTTLHGSACRDAEPAEGLHAPLVVVSHGYPGNRFLMAHLCESLAAKGFAVAAPDHSGSTYADTQAFGQTLLHRPLDQRAVIDGLAAMTGPLGAVIDARRTGLVGYSMGGYGALVLGGAGLAPLALSHARAPDDDSLRRHLAGSAEHAEMFDTRLKAILPIGPWGNAQGMWDARGIAGLRVPLLLIAGTADEVSDYAAMRGIFEGATGVDRHMLSFAHAGHNAAAPIPAPVESWVLSDALGWAPFAHYGDAVWDTTRMNNVAQHFAAAFFRLHLCEDAEAGQYLDGSALPGFAEGTSEGLKLEHLDAASARG